MAHFVSICFNPHQLRRAGDTDAGVMPAVGGGSFNPHQLRRAGDTFDAALPAASTLIVSIPTSSEEPVTPLEGRLNGRSPLVSIPTSSEEPVTPKGEFTFATNLLVSIPTSSEEPVTLPIKHCIGVPIARFNPHQLRRAGDTPHWYLHMRDRSTFQSPPAPKSR